ncbi:winged helix-turn-helix domain-containing protein, partial [Kibdelosporangium lantanae]
MLGPLEVRGGVRVGGRQRALLALLLTRPNQVFGVDEVVEAVWGDDVPDNPRGAVHTCVTRLRNVLAFCLLGLNPGPDISSKGAAALLGCSHDEALDMLDLLVAASLLENPFAERYRFHDLIRVYSADRAEVDMTVEARAEGFRRLADWYLYSVHAAVMKSVASLYVSPLGPAPTDITPITFTTHEDAFTWLGRERSNYLAMIGSAAKNGPEKYTWMLTDAARPDLINLHDMADLEWAAEAGLACAQRVGNRRGEAVMCLALGGLKSMTRRYDEAIADLTESRKAAAELGETGIVATAIISIAATYNTDGRGAEGAQAAKEALEVIDRGAEQGEARRRSAKFQLAMSYVALGRLRPARDLLESVLAEAEDHSPPLSIASWHDHLGKIYRRLGEYQQAIESYRRVLDTEVEHRGIVNFSTAGLAAVYRDIGDIPRATAYARQALDAARAAGDPDQEAEARVVLGSLHLQKNQPELAMKEFEVAHRLSNMADEAVEALAEMAVAAGEARYAHQALGH